jgi:hypothetical protein
VWVYDAEMDNDLLDSLTNIGKTYIALDKIYTSTKRDIYTNKFGLQVPRMKNIDKLLENNAFQFLETGEFNKCLQNEYTFIPRHSCF